GYRQNLCTGVQLPAGTRRKHENSIEKRAPAKRAREGEGAKISHQGRFYSFQAVTEGGARLKRRGVPHSAECGKGFAP
ncbi:MAG: hypothetical protein IJD70_00660, partial [Clostridia bacterium]|nr:hypothetical protein [Clostridia bacterium]